MARFIPTKGPKGQSDYYLDTKTNEVITKRQRAKILRSVFSDVPISNERLARMNLAQNPELALSRPARGRKSLLKVEGVEKATIIEARKEDLKRRKELEAEQKEFNALARKIRRQELKKVRRNRVHFGLLKPGNYGFRTNFNTYDEYLKSLSEAKKMPQLFSYSLGMIGFDDKSGKELGITVFPMMSIKNKPIPEEKFFGRFSEEREERLYFVFQHYFAHWQVRTEIAEAFFKDWKAKGGKTKSQTSVQRKGKGK